MPNAQDQWVLTPVFFSPRNQAGSPVRSLAWMADAPVCGQRVRTVESGQ